MYILCPLMCMHVIWMGEARGDCKTKRTLFRLLFITHDGLSVCSLVIQSSQSLPLHVTLIMMMQQPAVAFTDPEIQGLGTRVLWVEQGNCDDAFYPSSDGDPTRLTDCYLSLNLAASPGHNVCSVRVAVGNQTDMTSGQPLSCQRVKVKCVRRTQWGMFNQSAGCLETTRISRQQQQTSGSLLLFQRCTMKIRGPGD